MWDKWVKTVLVLVVVIAICAGLVLLYRPGYVELRAHDAKIRQIEDINARLREEKRNLEQRKYMLEEDPLTIEIEARDRLKYTKKGETVYIVEGWPED